MKKIIALFLAMSMLCCTAACNKNEDKNQNTGDTEKAASSEDNSKDPDGDADDNEDLKDTDDKDPQSLTSNGAVEAALAAKNFMNALCDFDLHKMSEYSNADVALMLGYESMGEAFEDLFGNDPFGFEDEDAAEEVNNSVMLLAEAVVDSFADSIEYDVESGEYENGIWEYTVEVEFLRLSQVIDALNSDTLDNIMEDIQEDHKNELKNKDRLSDEELNDLKAEMMTELINKCTEIIRKEAEKAETIESKCRIVVLKEDGEWVVDFYNTDIDVLVDMLQA